MRILRKKSIYEIRCHELIEETGIAESTFYSHYRNMSELVLRFEELLIERICQELIKISVEEKNLEASYRRLLLFICKHKEIVLLHTGFLKTITNRKIQIEGKKIIFKYWRNYGTELNDRLFKSLFAEILTEAHIWKSEKFHQAQLDKHVENLVLLTMELPRLYFIYLDNKWQY